MDLLRHSWSFLPIDGRSHLDDTVPDMEALTYACIRVEVYPDNTDHSAETGLAGYDTFLVLHWMLRMRSEPPLGNLFW